MRSHEYYLWWAGLDYLTHPLSGQVVKVEAMRESIIYQSGILAWAPTVYIFRESGDRGTINSYTSKQDIILNHTHKHTSIHISSVYIYIHTYT